MTPLIVLACITTGAVALVAALFATYRLGRSDGWSRGYEYGLSHPLEPVACALEINLPEALDGEGYLYVIEFSTGAIKVGQTYDPYRRLPEHRRDAAAFGVEIVDFWISPAHWNYLDNEVDLINRCMQVSSRFRLEYFRGVTFGAVVDFALELNYFTEEAIPDEQVKH